MEQLGVLLPGAVVVADNVLKPGSPLFLWRLCKGEAYENHIAPWSGVVGRYGKGIRTSGCEEAKELGVSIFPIYFLLNGEPFGAT